MTDTADAELRLALQPVFDAPATARRALATWLERVGLEGLTGDAQAVLSELVTNAVLHASTQIDVAVRRLERGVRIEVTDHDTGGVVLPVSLPQQRTSLLDESTDDAIETLLVRDAMTGRGLQLVAGLVAAWGVDPHPAGKTVWAILGGDHAPRGASRPALRSEPTAAAGSPRPVMLVAVPVRLALELDLYVDALVREFQVMRAGTTTSPVTAALQRIVALLGQLAEPAMAMRLGARNAAARGDRLADIALVVPLESLELFHQLDGLLTSVVAQWSDDLLESAPSEELQQFRAWYAEEVERQVAGRPPRPCPFPVVLTAAIPAARATPLTAGRKQAIAQVGAAVADANDPAAVARVLLAEAVGELGGSHASVCLLQADGHTVEFTETIGYPAEVSAHWKRFPVSDDLPASEAIRTGRAIVVRTVAERDLRYPVFGTTPALDDAAFVTVPILADDGTLPAVGALVVNYANARDFPAPDLEFLSQLCAAAGAALRRLASADAAEAERALAEWVATVVDRVAECRGPEAVLAGLTPLVVPRLADWCSTHVLEDGSPRYVAAAHTQVGHAELAAELHRRWPVQLGQRSIGWTLATGESDVFQVVPDEILPQIAQDADHLDLLRRLGLNSGAVVAVRAGGEIVGAIAVANAVGRFVTDSEFRALEQLAGRVGNLVTKG